MPIYFTQLTWLFTSKASFRAVSLLTMALISHSLSITLLKFLVLKKSLLSKNNKQDLKRAISLAVDW